MRSQGLSPLTRLRVLCFIGMLLDGGGNKELVFAQHLDVVEDIYMSIYM
jgi:hypothetical protein